MQSSKGLTRPRLVIFSFGYGSFQASLLRRKLAVVSPTAAFSSILIFLCISIFMLVFCEKWNIIK